MGDNIYNSLNINKQMKKTMFLLFFLLFITSYVSAEVQTLPPVERGQCIELTQTCSNCTYVNFTSMVYPNKTQSIVGIGMTTFNNINYNATFCDTNSLGDYIVTTCGDIDGGFECVDFDFPVTPSGADPIGSGQGTILLAVMFIILALAIIFLLMGFSSEAIFVKIAMVVLGFVMILILILYTLLVLNESIAQSPSLVGGFETFYTVMTYIGIVGFLAFLVIIVMIMVRAWKIKRGLID
jgi:hypothetical protein